MRPRDERRDHLAASLANGPQRTRRAWFGRGIDVGAPAGEFGIARVSVRQVGPREFCRTSETARSDAAVDRDGGKGSGRLAPEDAKTSETLRVGCELVIGRQERDQSAIDAEGKFAVLVHRAGKMAKRGAERTTLLRGEPLRQILDRGRSACGFVTQ
jgi:hypothetical protein